MLVFGIVLLHPMEHVDRWKAALKGHGCPRCMYCAAPLCVENLWLHYVTFFVASIGMIHFEGSMILNHNHFVPNMTCGGCLSTISSPKYHDLELLLKAAPGAWVVQKCHLDSEGFLILASMVICCPFTVAWHLFRWFYQMIGPYLPDMPKEVLWKGLPSSPIINQKSITVGLRSLEVGPLFFKRVDCPNLQLSLLYSAFAQSSHANSIWGLAAKVLSEKSELSIERTSEFLL